MDFRSLKKPLETSSPSTKGLLQLTWWPLAHYLSCFSPQIKLWDLRSTKCLREYEGHVNEYAYLPLHVHEEEEILVAGAWAGGTPSPQREKLNQKQS